MKKTLHESRWMRGLSREFKWHSDASRLNRWQAVTCGAVATARPLIAALSDLRVGSIRGATCRHLHVHMHRFALSCCPSCSRAWTAADNNTICRPPAATEIDIKKNGHEREQQTDVTEDCEYVSASTSVRSASECHQDTHKPTGTHFAFTPPLSFDPRWLEHYELMFISLVVCLILISHW